MCIPKEDGKLSKKDAAISLFLGVIFYIIIIFSRDILGFIQGKPPTEILTERSYKAIIIIGGIYFFSFLLLWGISIRKNYKKWRK